MYFYFVYASIQENSTAPLQKFQQPQRYQLLSQGIEMRCRARKMRRKSLSPGQMRWRLWSPSTEIPCLRRQHERTPQHHGRKQWGVVSYLLLDFPALEQLFKARRQTEETRKGSAERKGPWRSRTEDMWQRGESRVCITERGEERYYKTSCIYWQKDLQRHWTKRRSVFTDTKTSKDIGPNAGGAFARWRGAVGEDRWYCYS